MSVFTGIRKTAKQLVSKFGDRNVYVVTRTAGTFNPVTAAYSGETTASTRINGVVLPLDKGTALNERFMQGRVVENMRKLVVDASVTLSPGTIITAQGSTWNVVDCSDINPDGSGKIITTAYMERNG